MFCTCVLNYFLSSIGLLYNIQKNMYKGKKLEESSIINKSFGNSLLSQTTNQVFEREIDNYTRLLEQDKRKFFRMQQNCTEVAKEHTKKAKQLQTLKGKQFCSEMAKMKGRVKILENELDQTVNSYNHVLSSNKNLKGQIDELRKQKISLKEVMSKMTSNIEEYSDLILREQDEVLNQRQSIEHDKQGILSIKAQNQNEVKMFRKELGNTRDNLDHSKAGYQVLKKRSEIEQKNEGVDTLPLVRFRLRHLIGRNKERVKVIESYKKTMETIWKGFEEIKEESGINDIEDITSTFLKHEEQNHMIYEYIGKLNREIQDFNDEIQELKEQVDSQKEKNQGYEQELGTTPKKVLSKTTREFKQNSCQKHIVNLESFLDLASQVLKELGGSDDITVFNINQELAKLQREVDSTYESKDELKMAVREEITKYTKFPPNIIDELKENRDQKLLDKEKLHQFASDFWEKRRGKSEVK